MGTQRKQRHRFPTGPVSLAVEAQATGYEIARLLEFGGELAPVKAHRLSTHLVRTACELQQALNPTTRKAA